MKNKNFCLYSAIILSVICAIGNAYQDKHIDATANVLIALVAYELTERT